MSLGGDWALVSNSNSPGEGDITSLRQISMHPPSSKVGFFVFFVATFIGRVKTKKPTLLGGECIEIWHNEVMSPSPGELLFDASAQSPPSDKTVEMLHFY